VAGIAASADEKELLQRCIHCGQATVISPSGWAMHSVLQRRRCPARETTAFPLWQAREHAVQRTQQSTTEAEEAAHPAGQLVVSATDLQPLADAAALLHHAGRALSAAAEVSTDRATRAELDEFARAVRNQALFIDRFDPEVSPGLRASGEPGPAAG